MYIYIYIHIHTHRKRTWGQHSQSHCRSHVFVWQRDFLGTPANLLLPSQKCQGVPFSPILSKFMTIAAPPLVSTPFVHNQGYCIICYTILSYHIISYHIISYDILIYYNLELTILRIPSSAASRCSSARHRPWTP